jgi:ubiquinol-cytochrome c reductase cytochrome c1 subunit
MKQLHFRHLVNQVLPEKAMKAIASGFDVVDGPNDEGAMFERPGILTDAFPSPYPNEEAARFANGGALPPDLSVITTAKHEGLDYIFALLIGYRDPPAGMPVRDGLHYNPYFPGGLLSMPPPLTVDGQVEYEDGTPATRTQMAHDCVNFLCWASEPTHDERKLMGLKALSACMVGAVISGVWYRSYWITFKTRRIDFVKAVM